VSFTSGIDKQILGYVTAGVRVFHLVADYHGRGTDGDFVLGMIRRVHQTLVEAGRRDRVTLVGGGGIVAAEHVPKAIICGLDLVSLETPLLVALQVAMKGPCIDRPGSRFHVHDMEISWGVQRLKNLIASWRDQLLEVMGAMGLREVRRLRGEMGRAMFQNDLEREAFEGITGYGKS
jgi:glutamate synthase domain-containing protein 2